MQQHERDLDLIEVILKDASVLESRIKHFNTTENSFINDHTEDGEIAYDAIMSPVYRIAEDAIHLSDNIRDVYPDYAWANIRGFRNFVAHGYREVDRSIAWKVASEDIPALAVILNDYRSSQIR